MCVNQKKVFNKYIRTWIYTSCGKCPACQQQKAAFRANRIRMNYKEGFIPYFVTLTYDNFFVPYVNVGDLKRKIVPVYRDFNVKVVGTGQGKLERKVFRDRQVLFKINNSDLSLNTGDLKPLKKLPYRIGVCYYVDVQNFIKKIRIDYARTFGAILSCSYFACSEYGGKSHRPHFHLLFYVPSYLGEWFRSAVAKNWVYGNRVRNGRYVEIARDAASYVAAYVNSGSRLPDLCKTSETRQKHSYSRGFGISDDVFSLRAVLEMLRKKDLKYPCLRRVNGVLVRVDVAIPFYVLNRYFPKFKGFSRIAPDALSCYIRYPERLCELRRELDYSDDDLHKIQVRLKNCYDYYKAVSGGTYFDYASDFIDIWNLRSSDSLRNSLESCTDWYQHYYNNDEYVDNQFKRQFVQRSADYSCDWNFNYGQAPELFDLDINSSLSDVASDLQKFVLDPNEFVENQHRTAFLEDLFYRMCKQRDVTNLAMVHQNICV